MSTQKNKMKLKIPFYSNTPDNTHCFQACLKMVLKYFLPKRDFSWKELEKMSAKKENLWTWSTAAILNLKKLGFDVIEIEDFDYERFVQEGGKYLIERYGEKIAKIMIEHSDIEQERKLAQRLIKEIKPIKRPASFDDITRLMEKDYIIICNINSRVLNNEEGYAGHFVVIVGIENKKVILHDPGLPPHPNREVSKIIFERAWAFPSKKEKNLIALKFKMRKLRKNLQKIKSK